MKKVLVLEDEASIRGFIVINLRRAGYDDYVSIEFEGAGSPSVGIAKGRDFLLALGVNP